MEALSTWLLVHVHVIVICVLPLSVDTSVSVLQPVVLPIFFCNGLFPEALAGEHPACSLFLGSFSSFNLTNSFLGVFFHISEGSPDFDSIGQFDLFNMVIELIPLLDKLPELIVHRVINLVIDGDLAVIDHALECKFLFISWCEVLLVLYVLLVNTCPRNRVLGLPTVQLVVDVFFDIILSLFLLARYERCHF